MCKVAVKIKRVTAPISGIVKGYRLLAAVQNKARYDVVSEEYVQSFAPCYMISEAGDFSNYPTEEQMLRFFQEVMQWHMFSGFIME
jgi:hypothetical protein